LRRVSVDPILTREPGGTIGAEAIRALVLDGAVERWSSDVETLLMTAARLDHVERLIAPSLVAGRWVLSDRFADSTRVYQGIAGKVGLERVDALHELFLAKTCPDLTFVLDLPVDVGLGRRVAAGGGTRFEAKGTAFHEQVREGFLDLARRSPERFAVIDAAATPDIVAERVQAVTSERLASRLPPRAGPT
jgi:dTMP kinase